MKTRMRTRILALLLSMAMVMNGGISALASEAAPVANEETGHKHTAECYVEEKTVTCGLEQSEGHSHGEGCYTTTITCGQEEFEGHSHTDDCYTTTVSTCEKDEHTHSEGCNSEESPCGIEEHTHDDGCTTETTELTCGQEEVTGHTHDDSCKITELTCGQEEVTGHTHSDACYTTASTLVCTIPETETEVNPITEDLEVCEVCGLEECTCEKEEPEACEKCELSLEECTCEKEELETCENCELSLEECTCEKEEPVVCACGNEACECENCEEGCTCGEEVAPETVTLYEDDYVIVSVDAVDAEAIPEGITLNVVPVTMDNEETTEQYVAVAEELQETVKDENYGIAGFLAYDITFVDAEGNEVEPNGAVKISMSYKEAAVPKALDETVASEAEVTVMHLEENENGEVARVVDMKESAQLENIQTSDENKVEAAEFTTNSFSVFTIVWKTIATIKAYCVDETGNDIGLTELEIRKVQINTELIFENAIQYIVGGSVESDDYEFLYAYLDIDSEENKIQRLRYYEPEASEENLALKGSCWQFSKEKSGDNNWNDLASESTLYLKYKLNLGKTNDGNLEMPKRIPTVDSKAIGIGISLFNYTGKTSHMSEYENGFYFACSDGGIDSLRGDDYKDKGGIYTGSGLLENLVSYNLYDGYPRLNPNYKWDGNSASLSYLFSGNIKDAVTSYSNLNGLFQIDENGYYIYDSSVNHAELNESTNNIDVYDAVFAHVKRAAQSNSGQFLPFDKIANAKVKDGRVYEYSSFDTDDNQGDMWFGMKINANFYQPRYGRLDGTENGEPIVFEFSGDDDVWVFIDGVKVLDIGGIHGEKGGSINFATGEVEVENEPKLTILECFLKAYEEDKNGKGDKEEYLSRYFEKDEESELGYKPYFKNYTKHTMDFFYLERGEGLSNCKLKFNLPVLPSNSVTIRKEIENYDDAEEVLNDVEFTFKIHQNDKTTPLANTGYKLIKINEKGNEIESEETTNESGEFILRHNERAVFSGLDLGKKFYVEETNVSNQEYSHVKIDSNGIVNQENQTLVGSSGSMSTKELEVGVDNWITFKNVCSNFQHLIIEKDIKAEDDIYDKPDAEYVFEVNAGGSLYNGDYKVGKTYEEALASTAIPTTGEIKLKAGELAVILGNASHTADDGTVTTGFPAGTSFSVKEKNLDTALYKAPEYGFVEGTAKECNIDNKDAYESLASGKIALNKNAHIKVTNALRYGNLEIQKKLLTYNQSLGEAAFVFRIELKDYTGTNTIFKDVVSLEFNDAGVKTYTYPMKFPAGYEVVVTEVYSGASYELTEENGTVNIVADTTGTASFTNDYVDGRLNGGGSILNVFKKTEGVWAGVGYNDVAVIPVPLKEDEEDSETTN